MIGKIRNGILLCKNIPEIYESRGLLLLVVCDTDIVAGNAEGTLGDVEPAGACQELVGLGVGL